ncbi:hypothetical protein B0J12DRAFT_240716 [Macrophomina phaseolina]|uniref:Secreted protein n=1 Tax=Macrophomina phaseolina TaxID=35725 RepID=A0ABQ8GQW2_9PEZI|nr:hypothetical protein B0J12DRAFT_240716 [Macrophomina phaseolina]
MRLWVSYRISHSGARVTVLLTRLLLLSLQSSPATRATTLSSPRHHHEHHRPAQLPRSPRLSPLASSSPYCSLYAPAVPSLRRSTYQLRQSWLSAPPAPSRTAGCRHPDGARRWAGALTSDLAGSLRCSPR